MAWVLDIINDIKKEVKEQQLKGIRIFINKLKAFGKGLFLSIIILSIIDVPLIMLLVSVAGINATIRNEIYLFILLYIMEMLFIFTQMTTSKQHDKKEKITERDIAKKIIEILVFDGLYIILIENGRKQEYLVCMSRMFEWQDFTIQRVCFLDCILNIKNGHCQ